MHVGSGGPPPATAPAVARELGARPRPIAAAAARELGARPRWLRSKDWDEHVADLERMSESPGFQALRESILELARLARSDRLLDIGAGTGLLAIAAAPLVARVSALDASPAMCRHLEHKLDRLEIGNADVLVNTATDIPLADGAVDVVLSNYCLHHLSDSEKGCAVEEIWRVLRPGGRLVFADMMFRLSIVNPRDRAVIALLVKRILCHGPAGLLRLLKNATRIAARRWEHPVSAEWWHERLLQAGFVEVSVRTLDHEGGIAFARKPE